MTLSTQKEGVTSSIPFDQTGHERTLTPENTINVLAALKEISQDQIPPELQDLVEAFSESSCSQYQDQYPPGVSSIQSIAPIV
ncbi:hypothetical protein DSO57_1002339 [Entomophthora muscae]|uniref:Uncharacterized protein n=1 Tax=Entomophthora muscae TaxID=34485 RepID=A0ACC2UI72_9FUNG|nr:hypothetical protein DSO57_1002339 [Entomophthora muscae]